MTNYVKQKYTYFLDISTNTSAPTLVNITAGGLTPQRRLKPFFASFKYFKLGKVKVRFVPAATLPVDPTGLSYEAGASTVDPRDQFNPGLVRITNGEDVLDAFGNNLNMNSYYSSMLDSRWYKFQLQTGFSRTARPLLWNVVQPHQSSVAVTNMHQAMDCISTAAHMPIKNDYSNPYLTVAPAPYMPVRSNTTSEPTIYFADRVNLRSNDPIPSDTDITNHTVPVRFYDTMQNDMLIQNGREKVSWMPTDMLDNYMHGANTVPEVDLITVILPKAYKTKYYYRVYVSEEVMFKSPVVLDPFCFPGGDYQTGNRSAIDRFLLPGYNVPSRGDTAYNPISDNYINPNATSGSKERYV